MCGRYALETPPEGLKRLLPFANSPNFPASYNIAPSHPVPIIRDSAVVSGAGQHECVMVQWGLVPGWMKADKIADMSSRPQINARSETATEKPFFKSAFKSRRCLFPADAFYEWYRGGKGKNQPYCIRRQDEKPFMMAGIWEFWQGADGSEIETCAILTVGANETLSAIHHRMPVILEATHWADWLDTPAAKSDSLRPLLQPAPEADFKSYPVSEAVNKVANNAPEMLEVAPEIDNSDPSDAQFDLF